MNAMPSHWSEKNAAPQAVPAMAPEAIEAVRPVTAPSDVDLSRGRRAAVEIGGVSVLVKFLPMAVVHGPFTPTAQTGHTVWRWIAEGIEPHVAAFVCPVCKEQIPERPGILPFIGEATGKELRAAHGIRSVVLQHPIPAELQTHVPTLHHIFTRQRSARFLATIAQNPGELEKWIDQAMADARKPAAPTSVATHEDLDMGFLGSRRR